MTSLNSENIKEASFTFSLTELKGSKDWPAGANFKFLNKDETSSFNMGFILDSDIDKNIIITFSFVENAKLVEANYFPTEFASLEEVSVHFKWKNKAISMKLNNGEEVEITPLSYEVDKLVFGLQSSTGKIEVTLPNKTINPKGAL